MMVRISCNSLLLLCTVLELAVADDIRGDGTWTSVSGCI